MNRATVTKGIVLTIALLVALMALSVSLAGVQERPFPHEEHEGLFPLCSGCHEGVPEGEPDDWYPEPVSCANCHDGVERDRVTWDGPSERIDNVDFEHRTHADALEAEGDPEQVCADCHIPPGQGRMSVSDSIQVATCWSCHEHETDEHFRVDQQCESCHVPLAETSFPRQRIEALTKPVSHEAEDFVLEGHGDLAPGRADRCATCHVRERCEACHVDTGLLEIQALPAAPESMSLPVMDAHYPEPGSHQDAGWIDGHQVQASTAACSTCHTSDDCRACHVAVVPAVVEMLPTREVATAPGVMLETRSPESHASLFFMEAHPSLASSDDRSCQMCHVQTFCVECHDAAPDGGYHPSGFMARHAADAFSRASDCANCHSAQVFCRECHSEGGLTSAGRLGGGYHDGGPVWLLRHGQAARQGLESCASCHKQTDCVQCHGVLGAFKVSPHGPDFDAIAAWRRSPRTCLGCHVSNPVGGGGS